MITKSDIKSDHSVKCGICRMNIIDRAQIYQAGVNLGVVCVGCYKQFSANDLEMMGNMFIAYGGYFGMMKDSKFSLLKILENLLKSTHGKNKKVNAEQITIKLMHKALLHGTAFALHSKFVAFGKCVVLAPLC